MRSSAVGATMRALRRGARAVTLGGLLAACSAPSGEGATGAGGSGGVITGNGASGVSSSGSGNGASGVSSSGPGGGASGVSSSGSGTGAGGGGGVVNAVCNPIVAGKSTLTVNGKTRTFSVQLPANTSHMALLFLWHGWMQDPVDFASTVVYDVPAGKWVPFDPDAFPMPLMIVSPYDTKLLPPIGLDWDIVSGALDFPFFEAMLQCIHQQFDIEDSRIYSFGFSAGAVFTNLLSAKYPHLFAATISESGAWFNDMKEWSDVLVPIVQWKWPAFNVPDGGNVLLTHGGPNDFASVISLESANAKALPFLYSGGRTVMECAHTFGHTLDPDLTQGMYYEYMWAHHLGGPPLPGMLADFPTKAKPVGATSCTFHPYP